MSFVVRREGVDGRFVLKREAISTPAGGGTGLAEPQPPVPDITPVPVGAGPPPTEVVVSWDAVASQVIEGEVQAWNVRLSSAIDQIAHIPVVLTGTADSSYVTYADLIQFNPGETSKLYLVRTIEPAGGSSSETAIFTLDEEGAYTDPGEGGEGEPEVDYIIRVDPAVGPSVHTLTILNIVAPSTPAYDMLGPSVNIPEGLGPLDVAVILSSPAVDDVVLHVAVTGGTATEGTHFTFVERNHTIAQGLVFQRVPIVILDDGIATPNRTIQLTATLISGTATAGASTVLTLTIEDSGNQGGGGGSRRLTWTTASQAVQEGTPVQMVCHAFNTSTGEPFPFAEITDVPILLSGLEYEDWTINWGSAGANVMRFGAGSSDSAITCIAPSDADGVDETLILQIGIDNSGNNLWTIGGGSGVRTLTCIDAGSSGGTGDTAKLKVAAHASVGGGQPRRLIQGLVAVVPPIATSATLPRYVLDATGEEMLVVPMARRESHFIDSVYVYGFTDDSAAHQPTDSPGLLLRALEVGDTDPAETGDFGSGPPSITFGVTPCNAGEEYLCATDDHMITESWTHKFGTPGGPDIMRETSYLARPHKASPAQPEQALMPSGDACGMFDWCVKEIAGDPDVYQVEGRFLNGAYRASEDSHATNTMADGTLNLESLRVAVPAGWTVDLGQYPHPEQTATPAQSVELLNTRTSAFLMRPAQRYGFWFIVRRDSAGSAAMDRGRDYLLSKSIFWAVGTLGSTRQPIYGDFASSTIDWDRLGFVSVSGGAPTGWEGIDHVGEVLAGVSGSHSFPGYGNHWSDGYPSGERWDSSGGSRVGMWHWTGSRDSPGPTGFSGKHPNGAIIPHWGWWDRTRYMQEYITQRFGWAIRDVTTGSAAFWWKTQRPNGQTDSIFSQGYIPVYRSLWSFNWKAMEGMNWESKPSLYLAPEDRPWNLPVIGASYTLASISGGSLVINETISGAPAEGTVMVTSDAGVVVGYSYSSWTGSTFTGNGGWASGGTGESGEDFAGGNLVRESNADKDWSEISSWRVIAVTHTGYARTPLQDGWWCCRRYNAYRDYEELAAACTRSVVPHLNISRTPAGEYPTSLQKECPASILAAAQTPYGLQWYQTGEFYTTDAVFTGSTGTFEKVYQRSDTRGHARVLQFLAGFHSICPLDLSFDFRGRSAEVQAAANGAAYGEADTIGMLLRVLEWQMTSAGVIGTTIPTGNPNAYKTPPPGTPGEPLGNQLPPDPATRTGSWPSEASGYPDTIGCGQIQFQQGYIAIAIGGALERIADDGSYPSTIRRIFGWMDNTIAGRNAIGLNHLGADNFPFMATTRMDAYPTTSTPTVKVDGVEVWSGTVNHGRNPLGVTDAVRLSEYRAGDKNTVWSFRRAVGFPWMAAEAYDYYGSSHAWKASGAGYAGAIAMGSDFYIDRAVGVIWSRLDPVNPANAMTPAGMVDYFARSVIGGLGSNIESEISSSGSGRVTKTYKTASCMINLPMIAYLLNKYT